MPQKRNGIYQVYVPRRVGLAIARTTGTGDSKVYRGMKRMLADLKDARRFALLDAVVAGRLTMGHLYDAHTANALDALEASLSATDLAPHITAYLSRCAANGLVPLNIANIKRQLASFIAWLTAAGKGTTTADITSANASAWLSSLKGRSSGTRRQYLYALTGFTRYLVEVEVLEDFPLSRVKAPKKNAAKMRYVSEADDRRLVDAASTEFRALLAFIKATGADVSVALGLRRRQLDLAEHTADLRRTKTNGDVLPVALIEEWATPYLEAHCAGLLPSALLWPGITRGRAYKHHVQCCHAVGVDSYTLKDSRHSVAVRMIARGFDVFEVADQLNNSPEICAKIYARHVTKAKEKAALQRAQQNANPTVHATRPDIAPTGHAADEA